MHLKKIVSSSAKQIVNDLISFNPYSWFNGEIYNTKDKSICRSIFSGNTVYCVGAGPSLDKIDTSTIKNSVVLLLNSSYQRVDSFHASNSLIWFCVDVSRAIQMVQYIPPYVRKIITVNLFQNTEKILRFLNQGDMYFQPRLTLRRRRDRWDNYRYIRPAYLNLNDPLNAFCSDHVRLSPYTVMLNAICLAAGFRAKRVITLGFDLTPENIDLKYAQGLTPPTNGEGFENDRVERYLVEIKKSCNRHGIELYNWSPKSHVKSLPVLNYNI